MEMEMESEGERGEENKKSSKRKKEKRGGNNNEAMKRRKGEQTMYIRSALSPVKRAVAECRMRGRTRSLDSTLPV